MNKINIIIALIVSIMTISVFQSCQRTLPDEMTELVLPNCLTPTELRATIENDFDVYFSWLATKDADEYNLVVATDAECTEVLQSVKVPASEVPYKITLEPGVYYYKVQAVAEDRDPSRWTYCSKAVTVKKPIVTVDLSLGGTSNCYVISEEGKYKFKATKGVSADSVGEVASVSVVWETSVETVGQVLASNAVIDQVKVVDGEYIEFTTASPYKPGNALVAARDASDNIIWSWHIWAVKDALADVELDNKVVLLDRNIGELTATGEGSTSMLYQWGRKDPFPGTDNTGAKVTVAGTQTTYVNTTKNVADANKTPTVLYGKVSTAGAEPYALKDGSAEYWGKYATPGVKEIYDPCPSGYKVSQPVVNVDASYSDYNDLNITRFSDLASLSLKGNAYEKTLANGSKIMFSCTGYYLINTDTSGTPSSELVTGGKTSVFWCALYGNKRQGTCIRMDESGTKFWWYTGDKAAKYHAKNNAYAVRCEKILNE